MKDRTEKRHWPPVLHMLAQLLFRPVTNFEENSFAGVDYTTATECDKPACLLLGLEFLWLDVLSFEDTVEHLGAFGAP
jgi:hypothetical protein